MDKKFKNAESFYKEKLKNDPKNAEAHNNLGVILLQSGRVDSAKDSFQKAIEIDEKYLSAYSNLAAVFKKLGELDKAEEYCQKAIQINTNYINAHNILGAVFYEKGEYMNAIKSYERVIEIKPNEVVYNNLGVVFSAIGEIEKAKNCHSKSIQLNLKYSKPHYDLGEIFRDAKEFKRAAEHFEKVDTALGNAQFLECVYFSKGLESYNELLSVLTKKNPKNLRISAFAAYVSNKENINNIYPFCKKPLNYFFSSNLKDKFKFSNQFSDKLLKISEKIGSNWRSKSIVKNGDQSTGNLLESSIPAISELKNKFQISINNYRDKHKDSNDYFISQWPTRSHLFGWYIKLKRQGQVKSHIHEDGWLSGVFYLKVPKPMKKNEGSISLSLQGFDYPHNKNLSNFYYAPNQFDLILYPSSLFHYTVPFSSDEERHCIAFDVKPKLNIPYNN